MTKHGITWLNMVSHDNSWSHLINMSIHDSIVCSVTTGCTRAGVYEAFVHLWFDGVSTYWNLPVYIRECNVMLSQKRVIDVKLVGVTSHFNLVMWTCHKCVIDLKLCCWRQDTDWWAGLEWNDYYLTYVDHDYVLTLTYNGYTSCAALTFMRMRRAYILFRTHA